jgi:hypothetical protein
MGDFSDLFYVGAASERSDGCYGGYPYWCTEIGFARTIELRA